MLMLQFLLAFVTILSVSSLTDNTDYKLPIHLVEHPSSQTARKGATVIFRCRFETGNSVKIGSSDVNIQWLFNMRPIKESKQFKIKRNRLVIVGYQPRVNSGQYRCIINNTLFSPPFVILSEPAKLSTASIDQFKGHTTNNLNLSEGNVAIISCNLPASNPPAKPIFYHNNNEILTENDRFKIFPSGNLQINDVNTKDSGIYRCSARNSATGQVRVSSSQTTLKVYEPFGTKLPEIVYVPSGTNRVKIGANLTLECVANGAPVPLVSWEKFGGILPPTRSKQIFGNLVLFNVQPEDKGTYVCRAETGPGQATFKTSMVDVFSAPELEENAHSHVVFATDGENVELTCPIRSRPRADITWFYQGQQVMNTKVYTQRAQGDKSVLLIRQFKASESTGIFQCFAENDYGSAQADLLVVPVEKKEARVAGLKQEHLKVGDVTSSRPIIIMGPQDANIYEGQTVVLLCITNQSAGKSTQINWLQNDNIIEPTLMRRFEINQLLGNLRIVSVQKSDAGVYKCIASNKHGMSTAEARVKVINEGGAMIEQTKPVDSLKKQTAASRPSIKQIGAKNILLNWQIIDTITGMVIIDVASLKDIAYFKVEYKTARNQRANDNSPPSNTWLTINEQVDPKKREYILTDLKRFETYRFRVSTFYLNGNIANSHASLRFRLEKTWAKETKAQTVQKEFQLSAVHVQITQVWAIASSSLGLRWTVNLPETVTKKQLLKKLDGFYIYYRKIADHVSSASEINTQNVPAIPITNYTRIKVPVDGTIDSFMIENLSEASVYEIKMSCYNLIGDLCSFSGPLYGITLKTGSKLAAKEEQEVIVATEPTATTGNFLYILLGSVLAFLTVVLAVFIVMCIVRHRQHKRLLAQLHNTSQKMTSSSCPTLIYEDSLRQNSRANYATKLLEANVFSNNTNDSNSTNSQSMSTTASSMITPPQLDNTASHMLLMNGQAPPIPQVPPPQIYGMNLNINPLNGYFEQQHNLITSPNKQNNNNQENFYHTLSALGNLPVHSKDNETNQYAEYHNTLNIRAHLLLQQQQQQQQQQFLINTLKTMNLKHQQNYMSVNSDPKSPAACSIRRNTSVSSSKKSKKSLKRDHKSDINENMQIPANLNNYYLLPRQNQPQQALNDIDLLNIEAAIGQGLFNNPAAPYLLNTYLQTNNNQNNFQTINNQVETDPLMFNNMFNNQQQPESDQQQDQMSLEQQEKEPLKA